MILLAIALLVLACRPANEPPERIILLVVDTLRQDHISCYGGARPTPNIDALASQGRAHQGLSASFHQTSMSMAALFTGRTPSLEARQAGRSLGWNGRTWCGLARFAQPGEEACIPAQVDTLAERLRAQGYWTAGVVTNRLLFNPAGFDRGFDRWVELPEPEKIAREQSDHDPIQMASASDVNQMARVLVGERPRERLFLYLHYMDVHDHLLWRRPYAAMVEHIDRALGELLGGLEHSGLLEDAVVILVADHGERFDEQHFVRGGPHHNGNPSFEEVLRVPLIVRPAEAAPAADWLRSEDLFHHILGLAGLPDTARRDLEPGELFLSELKWQTYRRGSWKSYLGRAGDRLRLVNLASDPAERTDVAAAHPEIARQHRSRIRVLTKALASERESIGSLSKEDRRRLEALGYLEE